MYLNTGGTRNVNISVQNVALKIRAIKAQDGGNIRIQRKYLFALQNKRVWLKAFTADI